jgi:hypothetical protein
MTTINITCDTCQTVHEVRRTPEIPGWVIALASNWCPLCEHRAEDYWEQRYIPDQEGDDTLELPTPVPDNQLCMPFIFDELGIKKVKEHAQGC